MTNNTLTKRQRQIQRALKQNPSVKAAAKQLGISPNAVYNARRKIRIAESRIAEEAATTPPTTTAASNGKGSLDSARKAIAQEVREIDRQVFALERRRNLLTGAQELLDGVDEG